MISTREELNMSSWDFNENGSSSQKAEFTKFPVGVTRIRVIDVEPYVRWTHWLNANKRSVNCPGKGCPICEIRKNQKASKEPYSISMSRRFAINIFNFETGKVEIMEQGIGFFEDLREMKDQAEKAGHSLSEAIIRVKRKGTDKDDTSYRLDIDEYTIDSVNQYKDKVINLAEYFKPHDADKILRVLNGEKWEDVFKADTSENDDDVQLS
jgi:hypothetical protein